MTSTVYGMLDVLCLMLHGIGSWGLLTAVDRSSSCARRFMVTRA